MTPTTANPHIPTTITSNTRLSSVEHSKKKVAVPMDIAAASLTEKPNLCLSKLTPPKRKNAMDSGRTAAVHMAEDASSVTNRWVGRVQLAC